MTQTTNGNGNGTNGTFAFSDERLQEHPEIAKQLAAETHKRLHELVEEKEGRELLRSLDKLKACGWAVEMRRIPTKDEAHAQQLRALEEAHEKDVAERVEAAQAHTRAALKEKLIEAAPAVATGIGLFAMLIAGMAASGTEASVKKMSVLRAARWYFSK
jgi:hypothetical protein